MTVRSPHASGARTASSARGQTTTGPSRPGAGGEPGLFDRARAKLTVEDYLKAESVKLHGPEKDRRGPCILCDGGTTKFSVKGERWRCYGCGLFGDISDLVAAHRRLTVESAARWICGDDVPHSAPAPQKAKSPEGPSPGDKVALETWAEVRPFAGTLAERYLLGRGISPAVLELAAPNLRYHPSAKHRWDPQAGAWVRAPAMVAQVVVAGPDGEPQPTGGVHVTYLDRETGGKAVFRTKEGLLPSKRMWGPQRLGDRPGGAWLIGPGGIGGLAVSEGIETGLSVVTLADLRGGRPFRAVAALALRSLQGGWLQDNDGCVDLSDIQGDPDAPAFTWPTPRVNAWGEVIVAVDRDMSPVKVRGRTGRGRPCDFILGAEERARLCGRLAVAAWKATGAARVRAIVPPGQSDFNDELRRVLAQGGAA